jgi:hypothetical protein
LALEQIIRYEYDVVGQWDNCLVFMAVENRTYKTLKKAIEWVGDEN